MGLGTLTGGWRIVKTMGQKICKLQPVHGFAAETAGALTLYGATSLGIPVSTTHTITGAILGVGSTRGLHAVKWGVAARVVWAWVLTIRARRRWARCAGGSARCAGGSSGAGRGQNAASSNTSVIGSDNVNLVRDVAEHEPGRQRSCDSIPGTEIRDRQVHGQRPAAGDHAHTAGGRSGVE
jgi:hypothetical protein